MNTITWFSGYSSDGCLLTLTQKDSTCEEGQCPKDQDKGEVHINSWFSKKYWT